MEELSASAIGAAFDIDGWHNEEQLDKSMSAPVHAPSGYELTGLIERVTFFSEESGFCVLQVKAEGHRDLVTVVGSAPAVSAGEWLIAEGDWVVDKQHGRQLKAFHLRNMPPNTREGMEKYFLPVRATTSPAALSAVLWLRTGERVDMEEIAPVGRPELLSLATFRPRWIDPLGRRADHARMVAQVARVCRCIALNGARERPFEELADRVVEILR